MEHRQRAQQLYIDTRCPVEEEMVNSNQKLSEVKFLISQFLMFCSPVERYQFREYVHVVEASLAMPDFDASKAAIAFQNLELYMFLILTCPWKPEYKELRKYAGFYQSKIDAHLKGAETIFKLIGYQDDQKGVLKLIRPINKEVVLAVGFECLVASVECTILNDTYRKLNNRRITYAHIYKCRCMYNGGVDQLVFYVKKELNLNSDSKDGLAVISDTPQVDSDHSFEDIQTPGVRKRGSSSSKHDNISIPFADEDEEHRMTDKSARPEFQEGTFDDHMMASLQLVREEKEIQKPFQEPKQTTGSDEWSYVRDGLQNKYGPGYFDGPRGDVILSEETNKIKVYDEKPPLPHGIPRRSHVDINEVEQLHGYEKVSAVPPRNVRKASASFRDSGFISHQQPIYYPPTDSGYAEMSTRNGGASTLIPSAPEDRQPVSHAVAEMVPTFPQTFSSPPSSQNLMHSDVPFSDKEMQRTADRPLSKSLSLRRTNNQNNDLYRTGSLHRRSTDTSDVIYKEKLSSKVTPQIPLNYNSSKVVPQQMHNFSHSAPLATREPIRKEGKLNYLGRGRSFDVEEQHSWRCLYCTLQNQDSISVCAACGKSRVPDDYVDRPALVTTKRCTVCTFENPVDSVECEMCRNNLPFDLQSRV